VRELGLGFVEGREVGGSMFHDVLGMREGAGGRFFGGREVGVRWA
jgi:hypothetical protein